MALISKTPGCSRTVARVRNQLVVEKMPSSESRSGIRNGKTGFVFFTIKGHTYDYDPERIVRIKEERF